LTHFDTACFALGTCTRWEAGVDHDVLDSIDELVLQADGAEGQVRGVRGLQQVLDLDSSPSVVRWFAGDMNGADAGYR